jgi:cation diffusion facilitator family transporter
VEKVSEVHAPPGIGAIWVLVGALAIKSFLAVIKFRTGTRIGSTALVADAWNDAVDMLSASVALVAVALAIADPAQFLAADHYGGFAVGAIVIVTGLRVVRDSSLELTDTMPSDDVVDSIRSIAFQVPGVEGVEKCFARKTGLQYHVDIHIEVDPAMTVAQSHDIATEVRAHLRRELPSVADVLVHVEPSHGWT